MALYQIGSYNIYVAKLFGPLSAIYISNLDRCYECCGKDSCIPLSREQIYDSTGIDVVKQIEVEECLISYGILYVKSFRNSSEKNYYRLDYDRLKSIIDDPNKVNEVSSYTSIVKSPTKKVDKETKKEQALRRLKNAVKIDDEVLKQHLFDWIDSVIEKGGYLTTQAVKINIDELTKFTSDQDLAIKVILMATKNCWRDLSWAMDKFSNARNGNNFANYSEIRADEDSIMSETF